MKVKKQCMLGQVTLVCSVAYDTIIDQRKCEVDVVFEGIFGTNFFGSILCF